MHGGPLVGDPKFGQSVNLVAPEVDTERGVGRRRPYVDDGSSDRHLPPVLNLVLAAVAGGYQVGHQVALVHHVARADSLGRRPARPRAESLHEGPTGSHDYRRGVLQVAEPVQDPETPAHGLDARADPFEGQGLPGGEEFDGAVTEVQAKVVG